jgi:hypothetical protein
VGKAEEVKKLITILDFGILVCQHFRLGLRKKRNGKDMKNWDVAKIPEKCFFVECFL